MAVYPGSAPFDITRVAVAPPLLTRISYFVKLWGTKLFFAIFCFLRQQIRGGTAAFKPTYTKSYPSSHRVPARVFIPNSYKPGDAPLPLLIDVHGGGFVMGSPIFEARDNVRWANKHGFVVVSISYRRAPIHPYPIPVHDVADQIKEILDDDDLPIDRSRVAVIGYSAGGNLALAAVQLHEIHNRVQASVAYYPAVDFVTRAEDRDKLTIPHPDGREDALLGPSLYFQWGYVPAGTELRDPLLSPRFADRQTLPKSLYILGAEYDLLCVGAWNMAEELAEKSGSPKVEDTRDGDQGWECGTTRWKLVKGVVHGFNGLWEHTKGDESKLYRRKYESCQDDVAEWLRRVAFKRS